MCDKREFITISSLSFVNQSKRKPNDIDIDVFYVVTDPLELGDDIICKDAIRSVVTGMGFKDRIEDIDAKISSVYDNDDNGESVELCAESGCRIGLRFESLGKRIFLGVVTNQPYKRVVLTYWDSEGNDYIDLFLENVSQDEFNKAREIIKL